MTQWTYGPRLECQLCGEDQKMDYRGKVDAYIRADPILCDRCHGPFDLWRAICGTLERRESATHVMGLVECESVVRGQLLSCLTDADWVSHRRINVGFAKLLQGTYAGLAKDCDPAVLRVEWHTRPAQERAEPFPGRFHAVVPPTLPSLLSPAGVVLEMWPKDADIDGVWFECTTVWVDRASEWRLVHLADAFSAFLDDHFDAAVLPATIAVETAVHDVLETASATHRALRPNQASMQRLVDELLPELAEVSEYPPLPTQVTEELAHLRQYRNNIAHSGRLDRDRRGRTKDPPDHAAQARILTAALLAVEYTQLVTGPRQQIPDH